jgi:hypothetical protein
MANTTFNGPVRSENGFQTITKNSTTGAITVNYDTENALMSGGAGITGGTGTVLDIGVSREGGLIKTSILIDLTGLDSVDTADDIIGTGTSAAYLGQITAAVNGTIIAGRMTCFEAPAGGDDDIDLYSATEATGVLGGAIGDLTETQLIDAGDATAGAVDILTALPAANSYLYLAAGTGDTAATYTAGILLIEFFGTPA